MSNQLGVNSDGSFDPQFRHPDGRKKSYYERQDFRTRQEDASRHVRKVVESAADKVKAREPNTYRRQIAELKKAGPGYLPGDHQRHQRRLEILESAAIGEDDKIAEADRLEKIKADPFIVARLESIKRLAGHTIGDDEKQAVVQAKALAEAGHLSESEAATKPVVQGILDRQEKALKFSKDKAHLANESVKGNIDRIKDLKGELGVADADGAGDGGEE